MGGPGSGRRWHWGAAGTTGDYRSIDVRRWKRDGLLAPGTFFTWQWTRNGEVASAIQVSANTDRVTLIYQHRGGNGEWVSRSYAVYLDTTPGNLGGERVWFLCPARGCGRRVAILYGGDIFACRHCLQLAYPSQRESWGDRAARKADRIRKKLGWEPGFLNGKGWKPKGMHWKTFRRLNFQHDVLVGISLEEMARRFNLR